MSIEVDGASKTCTALTSATHLVPDGRIAVNLAPADLRKEGPAYNLLIAAALLAPNGQMLCELDGALSVGEL